ncbi:MAG: RHS repeat-associated core domain-containing protein [Gemmatimonadota bacterium]
MTQADTMRLRWKGMFYEADSTQLYYVRARWYDPVARRFISEDPIGLEGGLNPYTFGGNDPVNMSDPSGLDPCPLDAPKGSKNIWVDTDDGSGGWECQLPQSLPGVVTVGWQDRPWPSGFSPNFLDPCARGGRCGSLPLAPTSAAAADPKFPVLALKQDASLQGCRAKSFAFSSNDPAGRLGRWQLQKIKVFGPGAVRFRGARIPYHIGIYGGSFSSPSYKVPLPATGQVICSIGGGIFEAVR